MTVYSKSSPYANTEVLEGYLDVINFRNLPSLLDDKKFTITSQYQYRPDLLAHDLYQDVNLWWVFSIRNKDSIKDPIFDFVAGKQIYLPQQSTLKRVLGL